MYTIGQISSMFNIPVSTLRYYDKEGLFPNMQRESGIRKFGNLEIETLRVIECLKKSGLEIKDIKVFIEWCTEGSSTFSLRKQLFEERRQKVEAEIAHMNKVLAMLQFKCWYYEQAMKNGSEEGLLDSSLMPEHIRLIYENSRAVLETTNCDNGV